MATAVSPVPGTPAALEPSTHRTTKHRRSNAPRSLAPVVRPATIPVVDRRCQRKHGATHGTCARAQEDTPCEKAYLWDYLVNGTSLCQAAGDREETESLVMVR